VTTPDWEDEAPRGSRPPVRQGQPPTGRRRASEPPRTRQPQEQPMRTSDLPDLPPIQDGFERHFNRNGSFRDVPIQTEEPAGPSRSERIKDSAKARAKKLNSPRLVAYALIFFGGIVSMYALMSIIRPSFTSLTGDIFQLILAGAGPLMLAIGISTLIREKILAAAATLYENDDTADLLEENNKLLTQLVGTERRPGLVEMLKVLANLNQTSVDALNRIVSNTQAPVPTPPVGQQFAPQATQGHNPFQPQAPQHQGNPPVEQSGQHRVPPPFDWSQQRSAPVAPVQPQPQEHTGSGHFPPASRVHHSAPATQQQPLPDRTNDGRPLTRG